jgi:hypothetical protein
MLSFPLRNVRIVRSARFLLACVCLTDYHTLAYCGWNANLRWSANDELCRSTH